MKTAKQIQKEVKSLIIKDFIKKNEVISWDLNGDNSFGMITVTMPSTCEMNETMKWDFTYSYEPSNIDDFTEIERYEFPNMITEEKLTVKSV